MSAHAFSPRKGQSPTAATDHMPFAGSRTCAEIIEEENRREILRDLGRDRNHNR